jgi:glutaredoxin 3
MPIVTMYSKSTCSFCARARQLLESKRVSIQDISIDEDPTKREEMIAKSGRTTVPQIFINGQHIGGCDDVYALESQGELNKLLDIG